jgi:hypothetical protein
LREKEDGCRGLFDHVLISPRPVDSFQDRHTKIIN